MDVSTFLDLVDRMQAKVEKEKSELRAEMEAKIEQQQQERKTMDAKTCVSEIQLQALQERFDKLHQAKLLTDTEVAQLEDQVADFIECRSSPTVTLVEISTVSEGIRKLVGVCEGVSKDGTLARQLRRKFLAT